MDESAHAAVPRPVDPVVWRRISAITRGAFASVRDLYTRIVLGAATGAVIGMAIAFVTAGSMPGLLLALVAAAGPVFVGAVPLARRNRRRAFELVLNQLNAGTRYWREASGMAAPDSRASARRWIDSHPAEPIPISMLLVVGRLDEVDEALASLGEVPPDAEFDVELLRQTRRLYGGEATDLTMVREAWRTLPALRRDVARGELAFLEAQAAVASHDDPAAALAAARLDVTGVHWSVRAPAFVARWLIVAIVPTLLVWLVRPLLPV
jgi:hypothetical protein